MEHIPADAAASEALADAQRLVRAAGRIVVLTGAGISTDSGIPDYRGPSGTWTANPGAQRASTIHRFLASQASRSAVWRNVRLVCGRPRPNPGHRALNALRRRGKLRLLVTQNVDGLHRAAGQPPEELAEVHGSYDTALCLRCLAEYDTRSLLEECGPHCEDEAVFDPRCPACSCMLKPNVVFFGEAPNTEELQRSFDAAGACDLLLCVGSSLAVSPVNRMVEIARNAGARIVIVNMGATETDGMADVKVEAPISAVLPSITDYDEALDEHDEERPASRSAIAFHLDASTPQLPAERLAELDAEVADAWLDRCPFPVMLQ